MEQVEVNTGVINLRDLLDVLTTETRVVFKGDMNYRGKVSELLKHYNLLDRGPRYEVDEIRLVRRDLLITVTDLDKEGE